MGGSPVVDEGAADARVFALHFAMRRGRRWACTYTFFRNFRMISGIAVFLFSDYRLRVFVPCFALR